MSFMVAFLDIGRGSSRGGASAGVQRGKCKALFTVGLSRLTGLGLRQAVGGHRWGAGRGNGKESGKG